MKLDEISGQLAASAAETDLITWMATVTAVIYVLLAIRESTWCWSFGIVSSGLSVGVYLNEHLWYESILNVFYMVLGVYGWVVWSRGSAAHRNVPVTKIPGKILVNASVIGVLAGTALGWFAGWLGENKYLPPNEFAYTDALLTSFAIIATWMTARKYIENWIFWIIIDAGSAVLYIAKGPSMYLFALLFIFYTFIAIVGFFAWKKNLKA